MESGTNDNLRGFVLKFQNLLPDGRGSHSEDSGRVESEEISVACFMTDWLYTYVEDVLHIWGE